MLAAGDQVEHLLVHLDELVLRQRLLLLPALQGLLDLLLEEVRLDGVDDLRTTLLTPGLTLNRNFRLIVFSLASGRHSLNSSSASAAF